jgi:D-sedoheptulose 7-phosphate isomerase
LKITAAITSFKKENRTMNTQENMATGQFISDVDGFWQETQRAHLVVVETDFSQLQSDFEALLTLAVETIKSGHKIMFCGNGGSAADAQHIAAELSVKLFQDRAPIAGICLSLDTSAITACGNDYGFDYIFSRQVQALGREGDLLIGISTSGHSPNVLKAINAAKEMGIKTGALTGKDGGALHNLADVSLLVADNDTARIQEMHITLGHMFCGLLEKELGLV